MGSRKAFFFPAQTSIFLSFSSTSERYGMEDMPHGYLNNHAPALYLLLFPHGYGNIIQALRIHVPMKPLGWDWDFCR
jgi:hypothetical protein